MSTKEQAEEGISLSAMLQSCEKYIQTKDDGVLTKVYTDAGISGSSISRRPELKKLLNEINQKAHTVDVVLVWKLDRLSRNRGDLDSMKELLDKRGVELHSVSEGGNIDTSTAMGDLTFGLNGLVAQYYRKDIGEKTYNALYGKASKGEFNGGFAPFGYTLNESGEYKIDPHKAKIIKFIFIHYLKSKSLSEVARTLNKIGYKTARGKSWTATHIKLILENPTYRGAFVWNRRKNLKNSKIFNPKEEWILEEKHHTPVISQALWMKAQACQKKISPIHQVSIVV